MFVWKGMDEDDDMPKIRYIKKRFGRDSLEVIGWANEIIEDYSAQKLKLTVWQLYYRLVAAGLIPNNQESYNRIGRIISEGRKAGLIDWDAIEDRTRELRKNPHWNNPRELVKAAAEIFQIDKWKGQETRPEIWIEKDALLGVIEGICNELDVAYFSCRGYGSDSELWRAGQRFREYIEDGQAPLVLHFGDHDPSGIDMTRDIGARLGMFTGWDGPYPILRIALTMAQVEQYDPPPNPLKTKDGKLSDSRGQSYQDQYGSKSWELDALDPPVLVDLIRESVVAARDDVLWNKRCELEQKYQKQLDVVVGQWGQLVKYLAGKGKQSG